MSEVGIFMVGCVVFGVTVWGVVMAGGIALTRVQIEQNDHLEEPVDKDGAKKPFMGGEY